MLICSSRTREPKSAERPAWVQNLNSVLLVLLPVKSFIINTNCASRSVKNVLATLKYVPVEFRSQLVFPVKKYFRHEVLCP